MRKLILLILIISCKEKSNERNLAGKVITYKNDITIVAGKDTLTRGERLKYNTYTLHVGDTIR